MRGDLENTVAACEEYVDVFEIAAALVRIISRPPKSNPILFWYGDLGRAVNAVCVCGNRRRAGILGSNQSGLVYRCNGRIRTIPCKRGVRYRVVVGIAGVRGQP